MDSTEGGENGDDDEEEEEKVEQMDHGPAKKERLVVVVPGLGASMKHWQPILKKLKQEEGLNREAAVWLLYDPRSNLLGFQRAAEMVRHLVALISVEWIKNGGFNEILMVGHSLGGMIVRAAYVTACGGDSPIAEMLEWGRAVKRIVLLATPNRGIAGLHNPLLNFIDWCWRQIPGLFFTYQDLQRGSAFVANLRVNWIRLFSRAGPANGSKPGEAKLAWLPAQVFNLVGTEDKIVLLDDSIDVLSQSTAHAVDVPGAGHYDLPRLDKAGDPEGRYLLIKTAILNPNNLSLKPKPPHFSHLDQSKHIVFILHGIRASRIDSWLSQVAGEVERVYPAGTGAIRPPYGYFSALSFALPSVRRRNIRRFQDEYTEALARNPNAIFDFIGHSNGTYMLGQSLLDVPGMRFRRVLLAGSVLPPNYPWNGRVGLQVQKVRSERGRMDWPVGWLCSALAGLRMSDVGTGGYSGFLSSTVEEELFHSGGHGSMFNEANIPRMVSWCLSGQAGPPLPTQQPELQWWSRISRLCPILARFGFAVFFGLIAWLIWAHNLAALCWTAVALLIIYVFLKVF